MSDYPRGFLGGAVSAGLKPSGQADLGLLVSDRPATAAGVFTKNRFPGANIGLNKAHLRRQGTRAILVNAGQANACTGKAGAAAAEAQSLMVAEGFGFAPREVLIGSTGVIGVVPELSKIAKGVQKIQSSGLRPEGIDDVARAMMTTDTRMKTSSRRFSCGGKTSRVYGIAKGAGMIHPNMGTMLCYILTDVSIRKPLLKRALGEAVSSTFNCLTVDGDTSTSDMVIVLANGAAEGKAIEHTGTDYEVFSSKLAQVCRDLSRQIAADGEGATQLVTVKVTGAINDRDARRAAMAVASSNLVKCAIFGSDPNWGRIACAIGYCGAKFDPDAVVIGLGRQRVFANQTPVSHDEAKVSKYLKDSAEVLIGIELGNGPGKCEVWTCDLTYDYVRINAEYTT